MRHRRQLVKRMSGFFTLYLRWSITGLAKGSVELIQTAPPEQNGPKVRGSSNNKTPSLTASRGDERVGSGQVVTSGRLVLLIDPTRCQQAERGDEVGSGRWCAPATRKHRQQTWSHSVGFQHQL